MIRRSLTLLLLGAFVTSLAAQSPMEVRRPEEKAKEKQQVAKEQNKRAQHSANIEFHGAAAFPEKELRTALKEQITTVEDYGLSAARGDDVAFFLALYYRKHGYSKVDVHYKIEADDHLVLEVAEGPLTALGNIEFAGNAHQPADKLFEFAVGPTRERYSKLQKSLPFVASDVEEGADLVRRYYISQGFLDAAVDPPHYEIGGSGSQANVTITVHEGRQYFFGPLAFAGQTIYGAEEMRGQIDDLLAQPYTDARVNDIPRRLQSYFKTRGYYSVKIDATGDPVRAVDGKVPVHITVAPGPLYHFQGATVSGLTRLHPGFVRKRFSQLSGKTYSPEVLDEKFREMMRTGLFNLMQVKPVPIGGNMLQLDITAEEAKAKEFGVSGGYGSYDGPILGFQIGDRDLFGFGRPLTFSAEYSGRGYKGDILYEDPYLFDTNNKLRLRVSALTYDYDGYTKFEIGGRIELSRKITKQYEVGLAIFGRHVEVTSADIAPELLGRTSYFVNSIGFKQTLDLRDSPLVNPRGFVMDQTFDVATSAVGSQIDFVRTTLRLGYFIPFAPKALHPGVSEDVTLPPLQRWFQQSSLAFGARAGLIRPIGGDGVVDSELPIDERFFNGGANSVRSFDERFLGPREKHGYPLGGEFYSIFNVEYTFPIYGELQGATFVDAGNLLPDSDTAGLSNMRYAVGLGLRYRLPIGPIRLDYGVNPDPHEGEAFGAFHFSFGFAF